MIDSGYAEHEFDWCDEPDGYVETESDYIDDCQERHYERKKRA